MTKGARFGAALVILLLTTAPGHASSCQDSIDRVQAQADAIITNRAAQGPWRPESLAATRNYQPTPRSIAAAEGAGFGLGGLITIIPDLGILSGVTLRTIQKLSLLYGFEFNTEEETAELWIAAASAAGVDISRELLEKEVVSRFVPRVIQRIAAQASTEVVEKWSGRIIPLASSVIGAGLNYYFVRAWGERARSHFRKRHMEIRNQIAEGKLIVVSDAPKALSS